MSSTIDVNARSSFSLDPAAPGFDRVFGRLLAPLDRRAFDRGALDPFGFAQNDRLDPVRRAAGAPIAPIAPLAGPATQPASSELDRSVRTRMQQLHQTENARAARVNGGVTTPPETFVVGGKKYKRGEGDKLWLRLQSRGRSYRAWAKANPATARAIGPPKRVKKMIRSLRKNFKEVGSPLAKHAAKFVVAGYLSGYDPRFIAAFAAQESGWGRSTPANAPHNYWGWTVYTGNQSSAVTRPFKKASTAFRYFGRQLRENYGGARSVYSSIWAPYAADPNHERIIASILKNNFGGKPRNIKFPPRLRDA
jgi:hypothetical protein